jgi:capsid protein
MTPAGLRTTVARRAPSPNSGESRRLIVAAAAVTGLGASYYDAAASGRDVDWQAPASGGFEDFLFNGATRRIVTARFRQEVYNNPYLCGLVEKWPEAIGCSALRSRTGDRRYNLLKEALWYRWAKECTFDGAALATVEEILAVELLLAGELFLVKLAGGTLQLIASEFCGSPGGTSRFGEREVNGIVRDATGRPVAFRFGRLSRWGSIEITGTDAELVRADQVIHVYSRKRVLMGRGLPWLLASAKTARSLYEITQAKTKQIKDVTSITGAIETEGVEDWLQNNAADLPVDAEATTTGETADSPADRTPTDHRPLKIELAPGTFIFLKPGEKLHQLVNDYKATDYKELIMLMLHAIATPVGLPVELWFSGLGDVNYSGFKGLGLQWKARRARICEFLERAFLEPLHGWRIQLAHDLDELPSAPPSAETAVPAGALYQPTEDELIQWGWKRAAVLDDEKAAQANVRRLESGECSLGDIWAENGQFAEEVFTARRQLWIQLQVAAGELPADGDHAAIKVPLGFLLKGQLPGEAPAPRLPSAALAPENMHEDAEDDDDAQDDDQEDDDAQDDDQEKDDDQDKKGRDKKKAA